MPVESFLCRTATILKKKSFRFFFFTYKSGGGLPISKVSQTLKNVNQDPQGCPTIPHDHPMCLHHPVGAYLCVLSTTIFPYKSRKSKKKSTSVTPTSEKTSDSAFSSKVRSTKVKLKIRNSKNWLGYGPACDWRSMPDPSYTIRVYIRHFNRPTDRLADSDLLLLV